MKAEEHKSSTTKQRCSHDTSPFLGYSGALKGSWRVHTRYMETPGVKGQLGLSCLFLPGAFADARQAPADHARYGALNAQDMHTTTLMGSKVLGEHDQIRGG